MKRSWHTARQPELDGSDRSTQIALAIAQVADPGVLEALLQTLTLLDRIGGQVYIAADRQKYAPQETDQGVMYLPVTNVKEPGTYMTDGFVFQYEHIAKLPRQPVEPDAEFGDALPDRNGELTAAPDEAEVG